jgi:hypothetical protein
MTKLAFSVAAMLLASSAAFAGSDHFGDNSNRPAVDTDATASIKVDTKVKTGPANYSVKKHGVQPATKSAADEPGQGIWGN